MRSRHLNIASPGPFGKRILERFARGVSRFQTAPGPQGSPVVVCALARRMLE
jgi:hypothetical protein